MSNADTFYFFFLLCLCYILNYSFIAIFAVVNYYSSFLWLVLLYSKRVQCRKRICFVLNWFFSPNVFFVLLPRTYWYVEPKEEKKIGNTQKLYWSDLGKRCRSMYTMYIDCACATKLLGTCPAPIDDSVCVYTLSKG